MRGLQPSDPTIWIVDAVLNQEGEAKDIMLVGHFPFMPQLLGHLLGARPDAAPVPFPMNGMVALENLDGNWIERWRLE